VRHLSRKQLDHEKGIVVVGNQAADAGTPLQGDDLDRYIDALAAVIRAKEAQAAAGAAIEGGQSCEKG
jgi:hypothetical protein